MSPSQGNKLTTDSVQLGVNSYPLSFFLPLVSNDAEKSPRTVFCNVLLHTGPLSTTVILINNNKLKMLLLFGLTNGEGPMVCVCVQIWNLFKFLQ